jgi:hypothetical protein
LNNLINSVDSKKKMLTDFEKIHVMQSNANMNSNLNHAIKINKQKKATANQSHISHVKNNNSLLDIEDENLKEITILMKKILDD